MYLKYSVVLIVFKLLCLIRTTVFCFNIEDRQPIHKKSERGSYFGFSVAQHQVNERNNRISDNWILVGAPLGQNLQPGTRESGALFKCPITESTEDCEQIETDGKRIEFDYGEGEFGTGLQPPGADENKTGQWLGVNVRSQKPGGNVMVCAHRYIQSENLNLHHYGLGLCYILDKNLVTQEDVQPCKGRPMEKLHQQFGFCQVGTSLALLDDGFALMGAPGPYTWRGSVFEKQIVGSFLDRDKTMYLTPLNDDPEPIDKYSYLGMSVSGGHYFHKKRMYTASGAPRSEHHGQVFFFSKHNGTSELKIVLVINGKQFASGFGYEICSVDLNNDGYDDILVGAPFFYENTIGGAVYMYTNLRNCTDDNCVPDLILNGTSASRFGFAITSIGDINKDGYNDVAIGAPYERPGGAVHIYLGSKDGLKPEPSQVLRIRQSRGTGDVRREINTFGYSLSGGLDMDNNLYPDLVVGAYESDAVFLFKTRPIIDIEIIIKGTDYKNINTTKKGCAADPYNRNNTCFSFNSCFTIIGSIASGAKVKYQVKEDKKYVPRIWFHNPDLKDKRSEQNTKVIKVDANPEGRRSREYCTDETVYIKEGVSDILTPIKFIVNYILADNSPNSPILNKTSVTSFEATFQKDCGSDDTCDSFLVLETDITLNETADGYIVDMVNEEFLLNATVTNQGESAYEAKLFIIHPEALSYIALKSDKNKPSSVRCSIRNKTLVFCDLGNPLHGNKSVSLTLRFEIVKSSKEQKLDLKLFVNSTSVEHSDRTSTSFVAILQKIAKFTISNKATTNVFYGGEIKGESAMSHFEDIGPKVIHMYQIENSGHWQLEDVEVSIQWPYQVNPGPNEEGKWLLYLQKVPEVTHAEGVCSLPRPVFNPLNLTLSGTDIDAPANLVDSRDFDHLRRKRSEAEYKVPIQTVERGGKQRKLAIMDCLEKSARCFTIQCTIFRVNKEGQATIEVVSRLWNSTLVEDYNNVDWVEIKSTAEVSFKDETFTLSEDSTTKSSATTQALPTAVVADSSVSYWIIIVAVVLGLLLLILLIFILYKCGFFKRNRVKDQTLSGSLQKSEQDQLLRK